MRKRKEDTNCFSCDERVCWLVLARARTEPPTSKHEADLTTGLHGERVPRYLSCWSIYFPNGTGLFPQICFRSPDLKSLNS